MATVILRPNVNISNNWKEKLEVEYEQFLKTLQAWTDHRQAWYETKEKELKENLGKWDKLQLKSKYKEIHFKLKIQRTRWEFLISNLPNQAPNPG